MLFARFFSLALLTALLALLPHAPSMAQDANEAGGPKIMVIGSGPVDGPNYIAAGAICEMINRTNREHRLLCLVRPTTGTTENLLGLKGGQFGAILIQSDWQSYIYHGDIPNLQMNSLRHLYALQPRAIMLVVRGGSNITGLDDLKDKRVSLGPEDSGQRVLSEAILRVAGFAHSSFAETFSLHASELYKAMCLDQSLDAAILPANVPAALVQQMILGCGAQLVSVAGPRFDRLIRDNPYLSELVIPSATYEGLEEEIRTLAFHATLVTTDSLPEDAGYTITKSVFDNLDVFREQHPLLSRLDPDKMASVGATAPRHLGAERYFDEAGITR